MSEETHCRMWIKYFFICTLCLFLFNNCGKKKGGDEGAPSGGSASISVPAVPTDTDGDSLPDSEDNCPAVANPDQKDNDEDSVGDSCDPDDDEDGVADNVDTCPLISNSDQKDLDSDGIGDICDDEKDGDDVLKSKDRRSEEHTSELQSQF